MSWARNSDINYFNGIFVCIHVAPLLVRGGLESEPEAISIPTEESPLSSLSTNLWAPPRIDFVLAAV